MRAINNATIQFGLMNVPVKIYTAAREREITFSTRGPDGGKLRQIMVDISGREVPKHEQLKAAQVSEYAEVMLTHDEAKALRASNAHEVRIDRFTFDHQLPRERIKKTYYLGPAKLGGKTYALLQQALEASGRAALGHYFSRGKDHLVAVATLGDYLVLHTLYYDADMTVLESIPLPESEPSEDELSAAISFIEGESHPLVDLSSEYDSAAIKLRAVLELKAERQLASVIPLLSAG